MVDIERVITLDELVESVPENLVRQAESRKSLADESTHEAAHIAKGKNMSKELSKAQRIRAFMESNPEARNKDIVEALKQYKVTAADVANVKSISKRASGDAPTPRRSTRPRSERSESTAISSPGASITLPELEAGVAFVKAAGSIMRAKHLLIIIEQ
ncbi:MAG: hypothetical protein FJ308_09305, partial [Planctomycetes bacterium]|nr:hypothetical protein [Planctomycetota bacterium]